MIPDLNAQLGRALSATIVAEHNYYRKPFQISKCNYSNFGVQQVLANLHKLAPYGAIVWLTFIYKKACISLIQN